jgi:FtsP/CotA-like multicopper oxidase with cupredoxin domain
MPITRREFLSYSALGIGALAIPGKAYSGKLKSIQLTVKPAQHQWFKQEVEPISLWEFSETSLRLKQYQPAEIVLLNQLPEPTSIHWHGMRVDNTIDGVSGLTQDPIEPKQTFVYQLPTQDAGTYWAHAHHKTFEQLAKGVYLPIVVEEQVPYPIDQDLLFVIDDWRLNREGQIDAASFGAMRDWSHGGRMGNVMTVNRKPNETLSVNAGDRVRLRVLNAANAKIFNLQFTGLQITVLAKDGQPLEQPVAVQKSLAIGPAERYDLIIDIPQNWSGIYAIEAVDRRQTFTVAKWQVTSKTNTLPATLRPIKALPQNPLPSKQFTVHHKIALDMSGGAMGNLQAAIYKGNKLEVNELIQQQQVWTFNGVANLPELPLLKAKVGEGVAITIENNTRWPHAMHLHGHHFIANNPIVGNELWQDTLLMAGGETSSIRFKAERPSKWLLHCHMIEHQISGMVTWIEVST